MAFNKDAFLNQIVEKKMETTRVPFPEGETVLQIAELDIKDGTTKDGKVWVQLGVKCDATDANIAEEMGMTGDQTPRISQYFFLDIDQDTQGLAFGVNKNIELGKLRAAAGQNDEGEEWSLGNLRGATVGAVIKHVMNDKQEPRAEIAGFFNLDDEE